MLFFDTTFKTRERGRNQHKFAFYSFRQICVHRFRNTLYSPRKVLGIFNYHAISMEFKFKSFENIIKWITLEVVMIFL